eukprot:CAMPEP_0182442316 /NCGR_PEP_ID=MMETSP1172-20130603/1235_1 /TAXON_ID=708627 /ORGANISM="Timspurckia oligopyrenoides, Strain CCMP3278" /LENGTH=722 /DNA_ID=CAMNT_0024637091 /DNA_START=113 /DNA_END=2281 /DNA_ORIENTATION=+
MSTIAADKTDASSTALKSNPLLSASNLPLFGEIKAEHVVPAMEFLLEQLEQDFSELENTLDKIREQGETPKWEQLVHPLEKSGDKIGRVWGAINHLKSVQDRAELRSAVETIQPKVVAFSSRVAQSKPIYQAFKGIQDNASLYSALTEAQQRIVDSNVLKATLGGVALEGTEKERFNEIKQELAKLSTKFSNNVLDSTKAFSMRLTEKEDVEGLPDSLLGLAAQQAKSKGDENATAADGPWLFTLDFPSYYPFMQFAKKAELREKMYHASLIRASELTSYVDGDVNNVPICEKILALRKEIAALLGFEHYAAMSVASKMATFESATNQMEELRESCIEIAKQEHKDLTAFAHANGFEGELKQWDVPYWSERLKESQFDFEEEALRPYFSLPRVLDGLFALVKRLFGVDVVELENADVSKWDESVRYFEIRDGETKEPIANFFLDAYSRPAEKRGGAWMDEVVSRSTLLAGAAGVRLPVAHMVTNQSPPVGDKPSLMTFREVETLFHELGHALQHMLTREDGLVAGIRGVEWDCVELPSTFMENWVYDRATLFGIAKHYETGETLPEELYEKIKMAKKFRAASMLLRQLHFSIVDLELHSKYAADEGKSGVSMLDFERKVGERTLVMQPQDYDRFLCTFGHIFAGGYSAGYFSYKWAEVMSADAFEAFEEVGLENEAEVQSVGRRFRETVLALGGGKAPVDVFKLFRGREPSPKALLRQNGLH